ncbi:ABC-F family ATP-binding cassette domain-containing protein [Massilibacterium senegalense]|uniref:ABC-F family ATP-binding cassette domain-containing protein n=1 Tax=Massilibacterium senegalense TaxID=1632858 RepID=UPI000784075F|nr:ABC-F family ATP-binding cassette domain-containing protein [Massilibacterium senegalense]
MIYLQVNQLTKYYGADLILSNIKLDVQSKDKIALVGRNGAGKSTLLKIITGELSYDSGDIIIPKDIKIGYLAQTTITDSPLSIWDEMMTVFEPLKQIEKELRNMEHRMGNPTIMENKTEYEKLLREYDELSLQFKERGGYQYEADIRNVLHGLQFQDFSYGTPVQALSGGQKTRLSLGKLLLQKPDLLILDEPTNHLDLETIQWLEHYLQNYPGALLIVSHDRYFLDKIVHRVYELERHQIRHFHGNYSDYLTQKAEIYAKEKKQFEKQQEEIQRLEDFIARNIARASTTKRAQSRRKQLDKIDRMQRPLGNEKSASFSFEIEKQSGNEVLHVDQLSIQYDDTPIFKDVSFRLTREDSVALIGPNGIGKSSLLKAILGKVSSQGTISFGTNVQIGYYDQTQAELTSNKTILDELWDEYPEKTEKEIRTILGNFLFSGDDVLKIVQDLSGGEKARIALAKLMLQKANLLILDEPTNHLDLDSKEVLESTLMDYPGTLLFVSHDRYFINRIATKVLDLTPTGVIEYLGNYDYYVEKKTETEEIERLNALENQTEMQKEESDKSKFLLEKEQKKKERQKQRRLEEIEQLITEKELFITQSHELLCQPEVYENHEKAQQVNEDIEQAETELQQLMEEWEVLM